MTFWISFALVESTKVSEFIFDSLDVFYYNLNKPSINRGGSYIDSPKWLKHKKTTINPKNNDDKCFQCSIVVALHHEQIKPFIDQCDWKEINFPSHKKDCNEFETNNKTIALNILYVLYSTEEIRHAYKSKNNLKREN